ncbi:site-specific integrase [Brachybacterium sp. p3-SID957]|uniref:tyrosine-type recombinase/integrase n=1 Tax=Brachybacterium sp. p3-SID957 TaxID=2916049 RepID=UPI00223B108A|nr:site-specific integrase [Brachybacterium sp. p3-SID957]MCT1776759.1 site-specific integrase [Brachybacterium sp. p3-SID957]
MAGRQGRRSFGSLRKQKSGRWSASYVDGTGKRHFAPHTFDTKRDADAWLSVQRTRLVTGEWKAAPRERVTFDQWAERWLAGLEKAPRTIYSYRTTVDRDLSETFGSMQLDKITTAVVREWYDALPADKPAKRAQAYRVFGQIMRAAAADGLIHASPATLRGAATHTREREVPDLEPADVDKLAAAMPAYLAASVYLGAYAALRAGEALGLTRRDVNVKAGTVRVLRSAGTTTPGAERIGATKTDASKRTVAIPETVASKLRDHLAEHVGPEPGAYLFESPAKAGRPVSYQALRAHFRDAADACGYPSLTFHGLRHVGAVLAARAGATIRELQDRLGHRSMAIAMTYQHGSAQRDRAIADAMDRALTAPTDEGKNDAD